MIANVCMPVEWSCITKYGGAHTLIYFFFPRYSSLEGTLSLKQKQKLRDNFVFFLVRHAFGIFLVYWVHTVHVDSHLCALALEFLHQDSGAATPSRFVSITGRRKSAPTPSKFVSIRWRRTKPQKPIFYNALLNSWEYQRLPNIVVSLPPYACGILFDILLPCYVYN